MAKYIKKEIADLNGKGTSQAYYRMQTLRRIDFDEFLTRCHSIHGAFSESTLIGAITAFRDHLAYELANGYTVKIDGLGVFNAKIGVRKDKEQDNFEAGSQKRNAISLEVKGVSFRADKELVKQIDGDCRLERGGTERLKKSKYPLEQRIRRARQFLEKNRFMRVYDYASLNGLAYSTAARELIKIASEPTSGIISSGRRSSKLYYLGE